MKKIIVFGGAFNPPLNSHFSLAEQIVNEYENVNENENDNVKPKKNKTTKTTSKDLEEKLPEIIKNLNLDEEYVELTKSWIKYKRDLKEGYKIAELFIKERN